MLVLFHVTADTRWSDLPLSGAFVDMLKRLVGLAGATAVADTGIATPAGARDAVPPSRVLDGFGAFEPPPSTARPVPAGFTGRATADHPPGFYGPPEGLLAVNTLLPADRPAPIDFSPLHARIEGYRLSEPRDLRAPTLLAAFALLGLVLATIGVFGVVAYDVSQRTAEIGLRMAIGAAPLEILWIVLREGAVLGLIGVATGTAAAIAASRAIREQMFGISPFDPTTFAATAAALVLVTVLASLVPALRAVRIDAVRALRNE